MFLSQVMILRYQNKNFKINFLPLKTLKTWNVGQYRMLKNCNTLWSLSWSQFSMDLDSVKSIFFRNEFLKKLSSHFFLFFLLSSSKKFNYELELELKFLIPSCHKLNFIEKLRQKNGKSRMIEQSNHRYLTFFLLDSGSQSRIGGSWQKKCDLTSRCHSSLINDRIDTKYIFYISHRPLLDIWYS